jgi:insulysin
MKTFKPALLGLVLTAALSGCQSQTLTNNKNLIAENAVIKSQSDQRDYRYIKLENGLKILLISDPTTDKSAAAMDISVGAYHAPEDREGLLHFLEHMLFLGTEKYPNAGEYNEYLKKNGGSSNAYTSTEDTNYFFNVKNDAFDEALDRFAQFFIAPTMDPQFVQREKNAVDSEYSLKIKEDARRLREAGRQVINPEHPNSLFSVGNLDTLADRGDDKVYDDLIEAYKKHYTAQRMGLVVLSNASLADLEKSVIEKFSAVKSDGIDKPELETKFLTEKELATRVHIEPLREMRRLSFTFPITDPQQYFKQKPVKLITHFLGHEGENSLYQQLKSQGLIESSFAYVNDTDAMDALNVSFGLTKKGLKNIDAITEALFAYIDLIKKQGVSEAYYNEIKSIAKLNFAFQEKSSAMNTVYQLSPLLQTTDVNYLLNADYVYEAFNPELIQQYLSELNPQNMQQTIVAPGLTTDQNEPLYDVNYSTQKIDENLLQQWANAKADPNAKLPSLNPFVASDIALKDGSSQTKPAQLVNHTGLKLWHYQDTSFGMPKANMFVRIESPLAASNVSNRAMLDLAGQLIEDKLTAYGYNAKAAGLRYSVFQSEQGLGYSIYGYNEKQLELVKAINQTIVEFDIEQAQFDLVKDSLLRNWKNASLDRPISQVFGRMQRELGVDPFSSSAKAKALKSVKLKQLKSFVNQMLDSVSLKVLVHGNADQNEALALADNIQTSFLEGKQAVELNQEPLRQLKAGEEVITEMAIEHADSAIVISYPTEKSLQGMQQARMIGQVLSAAFFNDIRTTQQLGYTVGAFGREVKDQPSLNFYIQSSKVGAKELQRRIDIFIEKQFDVIKKMTDEEFAQHKSGLLTNIMRKDKNLIERTSRLWSELTNGFEQFDKREQLQKSIENMTKDDLISAYQSTLISNQASRMISRNFGTAHQDDDYKAELKNKSVCREEQCWQAK